MRHSRSGCYPQANATPPDAAEDCVPTAYRRHLRSTPPGATNRALHRPGAMNRAPTPPGAMNRAPTPTARDESGPYTGRAGVAEGLLDLEAVGTDFDLIAGL